MAVDAIANSTVRRLSRRLSTLIIARQTYAFPCGRISLRINTLVLSTSVQLLFLILKCSESFIQRLYGRQCCPGVCAGVRVLDRPDTYLGE